MDGARKASAEAGRTEENGGGFAARGLLQRRGRGWGCDNWGVGISRGCIHGPAQCSRGSMC
jgi:hypothetical protein